MGRTKKKKKLYLGKGPKFLPMVSILIISSNGTCNIKMQYFFQQMMSMKFKEQVIPYFIFKV